MMRASVVKELGRDEQLYQTPLVDDARFEQLKASIPLPADWSSVAQRALLYVVACARVAMLDVVAGFENGRLDRARLVAQNERLLERVAWLEEEISIKDARIVQLPPGRRPHYPPPERLRILLLRAATGWNNAETARRFLLSAQTVANWMRRLDDQGADALVRLPIPVNRFPDFVRVVVQQLKRANPKLGRQRVAHILARLGLHLAPTTVERIAREPDPPPTPPEPPPDEPKVAAPKARNLPAGITARNKDDVWHCDLTVVPTALGCWLPWAPLSVVLGWPFAWWVVGVIDQHSRTVVALRAFATQPNAQEVTSVLDQARAAAGRSPKHLITDQGVQFRADYEAWCAEHEINPRWGAVGSHKSIAIIERFWRSMKDECCRRIVVPLALPVMQAELAAYAAWYNQHRPHQALGGDVPTDRRAEQACPVVRLETRKRMPLVRGDPTPSARRVESAELDVTGFEGRKHLTVAQLRAA